jgi:hypothetical protein
MAQLSAIDAWYASEVAYLLAALAAIPEGDGSVLDHTLVVWGTDLARGSKHDHWPTPFVLAGRADGYFETGRLIDVGDVSHNRLLVSIGNAMGLEELDVFGNLDEGSGPLAGLR